MEPKPLVFEVEAASFQADVVDRSKEVPVVLLLWTDQVAPAAETKRILETLIQQYQGKAALALSDIARDPAIGQQLRVQSIPSIRVVKNGQIVDQMEGPQGDQVLREMLNRHTMSTSEQLRDSLSAVLQAGDWDQALAILKAALEEEPQNASYKVEWADVLVLKGDLEGAKQVLSTIAENVDERIRPQTRLEITEEAAGVGSIEVVSRELAQNPEDLESNYRLSLLLTLERRYSEALEYALKILQEDRSFRDDLGRKTLVRIMSLLERDSPLAKSYRRRMFSFMH